MFIFTVHINKLALITSSITFIRKIAMNIIKIIVCICFSFCINLTFGQDFEKTDSSNQYPEKINFATNKKNDEMLKSKLLLNKRLVELICHPRINSLKCGDFVCDSTDNIAINKSEVVLCLKNSFCWNVEGELPKIPKASVIKSLLKKKEKITDEEWKILNYIGFYTASYEVKYVDKYDCYQELEVNQKDKYEIHYEIVYDCDDKLKVVSKNIEKIKSN